MSSSAAARPVWEPEGGENALIVQPANVSPVVDCAALALGPTLEETAEPLLGLSFLPCKTRAVIFGVSLHVAEDPAPLSDDLPDAQLEDFFERASGNKLGGVPAFMQGDEFPEGPGPWQLLFQLEEDALPFNINFGNGVGYGFISADAQRGRFLWQR